MPVVDAEVMAKKVAAMTLGRATAQAERARKLNVSLHGNAARHAPHATQQRPDHREEGDLNPTLVVKFLRVFADRTAKNRHLPPPSVSGGHIRVAAGTDCNRTTRDAVEPPSVVSPIGVPCRH